MTELAENVSFDGASAFTWEQLNESRFLTAFFRHLQERMGARFAQYRFHILSSQDPRVMPESASLPDERKILFFLSDESSSIPVALAPHYFAIFKAYLPSEAGGETIFSFPLGCVKDVPETAAPPPVMERDIDVFFSGNLNTNRIPLYCALHPWFRRVPARWSYAVVARLNRGRGRLALAKHFQAGNRRNHIRFSHAFKSGLSPEEYARLLARSKIALCPRGFQSAETFRHMEAMRAGCIVISESLPDTRWYRDSPIVTVPDWKTGLAQARSLLRIRPALEELQARSLAWWRDVCCEEATARHVDAMILELESRDRPADASADSSARVPIQHA